MTKPKAKPIWPTYRLYTGSTPLETIWICDNCGFSMWSVAPSLGRFTTVHTCNDPICRQTTKRGGARRMRPGTIQEHAEANRACKVEERLSNGPRYKSLKSKDVK